MFTYNYHFLERESRDPSPTAGGLWQLRADRTTKLNPQSLANMDIASYRYLMGGNYR